MPAKPLPYDAEKFADTKYANEVFLLSPAQFKSEIAMHCKPLEDRFFEKGRLRGLAEADQAQREQLMVKVAGLIPTAAKENSTKDPVELAARANQLRDQAEERGHAMTNIEAVQAAYNEAGVAWK